MKLAEHSFLIRVIVKTVRIAILSFRYFMKNNCMLRASALTYYTLLSIIPVAALAFAIAKGFGCDEIGRMLERNGVTNYMIEIGGEITASGCNPKGGKWRISIDKPIAGTDSVVHNSAEIFAATDCGIATSGNYRNFKTDSAGHRYAHIIDPATGFPARSDILSATVIAPDCMTADAYATAFMVLGLEKSKALLGRHPELAAMFIIAKGDGQFGYWSNDAFAKLKIIDRQ